MLILDTVPHLGLYPGGGTLGISGWRCAARTLEPLAYTRASFSWILLPLYSVFFKFLSSRSFVKSRWSWVHLLDIFRLVKQ